MTVERTRSKSEDQRVADAFAALRAHTQEWHRGVDLNTVSLDQWRILVGAMLDAADAPPKWPTDASVALAWSNDARAHPGEGYFEAKRKQLREAFLADPIVKASVELRHVILSASGPVGPDDAEVVQAVIDAVNGAGL